MAIQDALPDRAVTMTELETLQADLPERYQVMPGSAISFDERHMVPAVAIQSPDGSVDAFGYRPDRDTWVEIERWTAETHTEDAQQEAIQRFADRHFPEDRVDWLLGE
ncbi:MAG: hypothetical protein ABEJ27_00700 [Halodesulfurarchaeum sp.]